MTKSSFRQLLQAVKETPEYVAQKKSVEFLAEINTLMVRKGINKAQLAEKIGCSPAYITKLFTGSSNLTMETMTKLAHAMEARVNIKICDGNESVRWLGIVDGGKKDVKPVPIFSGAKDKPWRSFNTGGAIPSDQDSAIAA